MGEWIKEEEVVGGERADFVAVEAGEVELMEWEEWCSSSNVWMVGDEQMSWGTSWWPCWDIEFMGEAYDDLYSDVVWDDDIWDLKGIKEVPN
ncbi:hypothetical protein DCAR_0935031 [Daucus carota subsp. sativus]|uniref:Uncharacterized protein n=1 Tax=Daucus carota subsp. sativus TaxID=79200 RepID=A0A175YGU7_DAUCS|nr:hypothetical protein DCAR_0935031 [Daucus carota subsp. sativus]